MMRDCAQEIAVDGVLVVNKPEGWTSHDVVAKVRGLLGIAKVGHTGTLDPAATGVLLLCLGKATRIAEYLVQAEKEYRAVLRLGVTTDTQDATGVETARSSRALPDRAAIEAAMGRFVGQHQQTPPMYSAVKIQGVPLYKSARAGRIVDRPARDYTVQSLQILSIIPTPPEAARAGGVQPPPATMDVTFDVVCSKGTYVRTLCADIGEALSVGGHLAVLDRRRVGRFGLDEALTLDDLSRLAGQESGETLRARLHSLADVLDRMPALTLDQRASEGVRHGVPVSLAQVIERDGHWEAGASVRLQAEDRRLLAVGKVPCGSEAFAQAPPGTVITLEKVLA